MSSADNKFPCLHCSRQVLDHHQAGACDTCGGWQHRACGNTGISKYMYAKMKRGQVDLEFVCDICSNADQVSVLELPVAESTRLSLAADITSEVTSLRSENHESTIYDQATVIDEDIFDQSTITDDVPTTEEIADSQSEDTDITASLYLPPVPLPAPLEEESIADEPPVYEHVAVDRATTFTVVPGGSAKGRDLLVDSTGYSYNIKRQSGTTTNWWCSVRNKKLRCSATVIQKGDHFRRGIHKHVHQAAPGLLHKIQIIHQVKDAAAADVFKPAMGIVEEKLHQLDQGAFNIPQPDLIARKANRYRQKGRPAEPRGDDFELAEGYIPTDFLRHDLKVDGARHIIFATSNQLELLQQAKRWYGDGTFKVLRTKDTFNQLFSIHALVMKDGETKQVPLTYVFMTYYIRRPSSSRYKSSWCLRGN